MSKSQLCSKYKQHFKYQMLQLKSNFVITSISYIRKSFLFHFMKHFQLIFQNDHSIEILIKLFYYAVVLENSNCKEGAAMCG
jgi:hypothetical protein